MADTDAFGGRGGTSAACLPTGVLRWAVETAAWSPDEREFSAALSLLPAGDAEAVKCFVQREDQKRALVSRLLQRAAVAHVCGVPGERVEIGRTRGKKPFTLNAKPQAAPNFNFNVSHEGRFTALASDPLCVVGIDIAAPRQLAGRKNMPFPEAVEALRSEFSHSEWATIQSFAPDAAGMEACFQRLWSLKEAYIKARGDGLGFSPLSRAEFAFERDVRGGSTVGGGAAVLWLDGELRRSWCFELGRLGGDHVVCVARGPPREIVDAFGAFTATFGRFGLSDEELGKHVRGCPGPPFTVLQVSALLEMLGGGPAEEAGH